MPDSGSEVLDSRVLRWLKEQGYSLEMRVAQTFKQAGFEVSQSRRYVDPESNEIREIDVVASLSRQVAAIDVAVTLLVECKYSLEKPWVIFTSTRTFDPLFYFSRILHEKYNVYDWTALESLQGRLLARILLSLGHTNASKSAFFSMPQNAGYNMIESLRDPKGKDPAYAAIRQVSSCVQAYDLDTEKTFQETIQEYENPIEPGLGRGKLPLFCNVAFPIIVVKGKLFECYLNPKNEIAITEVDNSVVLVSNKDIGEESRTKPCTSVIRVITESHAGTLAAAAYQAATMLLSQDSAIQDLWESEFHKLEKAEIEETPF